MRWFGWQAQGQSCISKRLKRYLCRSRSRDGIRSRSRSRSRGRSRSRSVFISRKKREEDKIFCGLLIMDLQYLILLSYLGKIIIYTLSVNLESKPFPLFMLVHFLERWAYPIPKLLKLTPVKIRSFYNVISIYTIFLLLSFSYCF